MKTILVVGASGFVGGRLTKALLDEGYPIRVLARNPARVQDLAATGCEIVQGDISDLSSVQRAMESIQAVYISIHTLSPQQTSGGLPRFMDVEKNGIHNIVTACRSRGTHRVVYVTSLGIARDAPSEWLRERWQTEQLLLNSDLDATVLRPGMIVGVGGRGFDTIVSQAKRRIAITMIGNRPKLRTIALDDLIAYLVGILDDSHAYGQCYDVGNDDVHSFNQMIDIVAEIIGGRPPLKFQMPPALLGALAPVIERMSKLPSGAINGFVDSLKTDGIGDPTPIRAILPRPLLSFRQATGRALTLSGSL